MGTRATIKFYNSEPKKDSKPLVAVYYQYDGYYDGVGTELADWLANKKMINGISDQTMKGGYANGMGCLAAQFIKYQKEEIGGFYITSPDDEQGYDYQVWQEGNKLMMAIDKFKGEPTAFAGFIASQEEEE